MQPENFKQPHFNGICENVRLKELEKQNFHQNSEKRKTINERLK